MRLFDCEQSAQDDLLDSGQEVQYDNEESPFKTKSKKYSDFIY